MTDRFRLVVITRDQARAELWREIWGTDLLPVLSQDPAGTPPCYLLDVARFDAPTIARALEWARAAFKLATIDEARAELQRYGGFPIKAEGCRVYRDLRE